MKGTPAKSANPKCSASSVDAEIDMGLSYLRCQAKTQTLASLSVYNDYELCIK